LANATNDNMTGTSTSTPDAAMVKRFISQGLKQAPATSFPD
jgi:hypothetical protein